MCKGTVYCTVLYCTVYCIFNSPYERERIKKNKSQSRGSTTPSQPPAIARTPSASTQTASILMESVQTASVQMTESHSVTIAMVTGTVDSLIKLKLGPQTFDPFVGSTFPFCRRSLKEVPVPRNYLIIRLWKHLRSIHHVYFC